MKVNYKIELYQKMLRIRRIEEAIADRYSEWEMRCPMHLSIGQEAVAVGVCSALNVNDLVFSGHRAHAHYLAKGGDLNALIAEMYGLSSGCSGGRGGSMHLTDLIAGFQASTPIVGGTVPMAVGAAWSMQHRRKDSISVVFFGDGCFEEGVVHESLNYAALKSLPVIFVCENNRYSVYTPLQHRQPKREIYKVAEAHGVISYSGDGNDIVAVSKISNLAVRDVKTGKGPRFLEFSTHRWREHCGPNDDDVLGYREDGELSSWQARCPLLLLEKTLKTDISTFSDLCDEFEFSIADEIERAFSSVVDRELPDVSTLNRNLYAK